MNHLDRLIALRERGLCTEGLGPEAEWDPVSADQHQTRHNRYWAALTPMLEAAYTDDPLADDDTLPDWMSERATAALANNDR